MTGRQAARPLLQNGAAAKRGIQDPIIVLEEQHAAQPAGLVGGSHVSLLKSPGNRWMDDVARGRRRRPTSGILWRWAPDSSRREAGAPGAGGAATQPRSTPAGV
eukprot:3442285-Alexandrium_andersonii.AAC.1